MERYSKEPESFDYISSESKFSFTYILFTDFGCYESQIYMNNKSRISHKMPFNTFGENQTLGGKFITLQ